MDSTSSELPPPPTSNHIPPDPPSCAMDAGRSELAPPPAPNTRAPVPPPLAPSGQPPNSASTRATATMDFRPTAQHPAAPPVRTQTTSFHQSPLAANSNLPHPQIQHIRASTGNRQAPLQPANCPSAEVLSNNNDLAWPANQNLIGNTRRLIQKRRGRKPRTGDDYRSAPNEETALAKAIRTAPSRPGEAIFFPYEGTTFNNVEEAKEFYNLYSWERGFGIRLNRGRRTGVGFKTVQDLICSCQGRPHNPNSASSRTGCKAHIRLYRRSDLSWYIGRVDDTHNHPLTEACGQNKQWSSHGDLDPTTKDFIRKLRENNVSLGRICNILGVNDSCTRKQTVRAMCAKISQQNLVDDIGKTMNLLTEMKSKDPGLEIRFQIDNNGTLKSMLWCTGKNRYDYSRFGDAVTFDTTC
ncbi:unnamed protein product [Urochloa humidicola]